MPQLCTLQTAARQEELRVLRPCIFKRLSPPSTVRFNVESQNGCPGRTPAQRCSLVFTSCNFPACMESNLGEGWDRPRLSRSRAEGCSSSPSSLGQWQPAPVKERKNWTRVISNDFLTCHCLPIAPAFIYFSIKKPPSKQSIALLCYS